MNSLIVMLVISVIAVIAINFIAKREDKRYKAKFKHFDAMQISGNTQRTELRKMLGGSLHK